MKEYKLSNKTIRIYDEHEALVAAGSNESDGLFQQDSAIEEFFRDCTVGRIRWNPQTYNEELTRLVSEGVDVIIIQKDEK